ncbi:hypothetical protein ACQPYA_27070 [Micromonospora sp. CA-263727]|uniref:hypothetical protein n=1 Tax=Micromonospora sp. CA-263727 TaxID=3239967 RepID=UPI003D8D0A39
MKAHRTDVVSFAFGLLFLALTAWWLLAQVLGLVLPPVGWFLAGGLILIGALGLIGALRSSRHTSRPEPSGSPWTDPTEDGRTIVDPTSGPGAAGEAGPGAAGEPAEERPADGDRTLDLPFEDEPSPGKRGSAG